MAVPTATLLKLKTGFESRRSPRASEPWSLTGGSGGSSDDDEVTLASTVKKPAFVFGAVSVTSITGSSIVVKLLTALAEGEVIYIEVIGLPA